MGLLNGESHEEEESQGERSYSLEEVHSLEEGNIKQEEVLGADHNCVADEVRL